MTTTTPTPRLRQLWISRGWLKQTGIASGEYVFRNDTRIVPDGRGWASTGRYEFRSKTFEGILRAIEARRNEIRAQLGKPAETV